MASWTDQSTDSLLPGEPWTSAKALAAFENPVAVAEAATGAPIMVTGWHGYNAVNVGDGNTGRFYNSATDGTVATIETPNFADGFEYRILARALDTIFATPTLLVDYLIGGAWENIYTSTSTAAGPLDADLWLRSPRRSARRFVLDYSIAFASSGSSWGPTNGDQENGLASIADNAATVVTRARLRWSSGDINAGQAFLLRRREY